MAERLETIARRLVQKKEVYQRDKAQAEASERDYRSEERDFWELMNERHGSIKTMTLDLGDPYGSVQFQRRETITGRVLSDEAAEKALRELGMADEVLAPTHNVRKKVLNARVREMLEAGEPLPDGIDFNSRKFITVTRKD